MSVFAVSEKTADTPSRIWLLCPGEEDGRMFGPDSSRFLSSFLSSTHRFWHICNTQRFRKGGGCFSFCCVCLRSRWIAASNSDCMFCSTAVSKICRVPVKYRASSVMHILIAMFQAVNALCASAEADLLCVRPEIIVDKLIIRSRKLNNCLWVYEVLNLKSKDFQFLFSLELPQCLGYERYCFDQPV